MLGVPCDADPAAIKAAWRQRALGSHPDKPGGSDEASRQVMWDFTVLFSDRAAYDAARAAALAAAAPAPAAAAEPAAAPPPKRRKAEPAQAGPRGAADEDGTNMPRWHGCFALGTVPPDREVR